MRHTDGISNAMAAFLVAAAAGASALPAHADLGDQLFKLLAEDTLEERIAMMIDRKRQLLGDVVQADHPRLGKIFSSEELLELLCQIE